jgi:hypothetical protein
MLGIRIKQKQCRAGEPETDGILCFPLVQLLKIGPPGGITPTGIRAKLD